MKIEESRDRFCRNIHWRRLKSGMTLTELAEHSELPLWMLEELEKSVIPEDMMVDDAVSLARTFGCKVHELFE